jgi:peptidoglycan/LPS O-acetylase OafA/YrhL
MPEGEQIKPRFTYTERNSIFEYMAVFNFRKMYEHLAGTRAKPWDDRELDVFDGIKVWSFFVYTVGQTAFALFLTWLNNIFTLFSMLRMLPVNSFLMSNIALEVFVFVSAFFTSYRCFQIMDAQDSVLSIGDYLKIVAKKFMRLAPVYYVLWLVVWVITSRVVFGPISYTANGNMATCSEDWVWTLFMLGNLGVEEMTPYYGCYQQSWPLAMDMQLTLVIPFLAILLWKVPYLGVASCFGLIIGNAFVNYYITLKYDLRIGLVAESNYFVLLGIISKP